jgi:hypothetical protein
MSALGALRRPLLVCLITGVSVAISATGRVTPALVLSTTVTWSYIVLLQLALALAVIAPRARRGVGLAGALDLFFAGHAPWSLVILAIAAVRPVPLNWPGRYWLVAAAIIAAAATARIIAAFFREVLAMDARAARRMTILHQAITWTAFLAVSWLQSAFTPRLIELWRR